MSVIYPKSPTEHDRRVGALGRVIDRVSLSRSQSAERKGLTAIVLERAATVVLVLIVGVGSAIAASGGSLTIDLSRRTTRTLGRRCARDIQHVLIPMTQCSAI